jgi:hypothetical protein
MRSSVRWTAVLTSVALACSGLVLVLPAAAAVPGTKCTKPGAYVTTGNRVLVCQSNRTWKAHSVAKVNAACPKRGLVATVGGSRVRCATTLRGLRWTSSVVAAPTVPVPDPTEGDACVAVGARREIANGYLECREVAGRRLQYFKLSSSPAAPLSAQSPRPLDDCRVRDARVTKSIGFAIAYPTTSAPYPPFWPSPTRIRVAVVPIDFPDVPGTGNPRDLVVSDVQRADDWLAHFSNGKVSYDWSIGNSWIRATKPSSDYVWIQPGGVNPNPLPGAKASATREPNDIVQDHMIEAQGAFDFRGVGAVLFVYPTEVVNIWPGITGVMRGTTSQGPYYVHAASAAAWLYRTKEPLWSWLIHEHLHPFGLAGHSPDGSPLDILGDQGGRALTLSSWDSIIMDWQTPEQIYCTTRETLTRSEVALSPLDRFEKGTKAVIVRLSDREVLVIESRRRDHWSSGSSKNTGLPPGFYGLTVTRVDTSIDVWRSWVNEGYARYVTNRASSHTDWPGIALDMDNVLYLGESLTTDGVRITLVKSGDHDTVLIERS